MSAEYLKIGLKALKGEDRGGPLSFVRTFHHYQHQKLKHGDGCVMTLQPQSLDPHHWVKNYYKRMIFIRNFWTTNSKHLCKENNLLFKKEVNYF